MACLFFLTAGLDMWKHFPQFGWVAYLCFGLYWLLFLPRQVGEPFRTYLRNPRAIAMVGLLIASLVGFGYNVLFALAK